MLNHKNVLLSYVEDKSNQMLCVTLNVVFKQNAILSLHQYNNCFVNVKLLFMSCDVHNVLRIKHGSDQYVRTRNYL